MSKRMNMIVDLQFGSCGKGLFAGYLAKRTKPDTIVTAWAPNAGHTFVDAKGNKMVTCMLPNGIVSDGVDNILLGPGSVINPELLMTEIEQYIGDSAYPKISIHEHAAVVTEGHRILEASYGSRIGSTMKGCGEAVIEKIRRIPHGNSNTAKDALLGTPLEGMVVGQSEYADILDASSVVQVEGAQGFSLGINSGFYPYTTSRECTVQQLMVDCAIPRNMFDIRVFGAARTYPIRVSNRYDADGNIIGTSGPGYHDQDELTWDQVGQPPEFTTVTKLQRRVFDFSMEQIRQAVRMNGVDFIFLNFANYMKSQSDLHALVEEIEIETGVPVAYLGYGPREDQVVMTGKINTSAIYFGEK